MHFPKLTACVTELDILEVVDLSFTIKGDTASEVEGIVVSGHLNITGETQTTTVHFIIVPATLYGCHS